MSTKLTGYVWDGCASSGMKLSSVAIMARLADFSSDEGVCWPSIATIARQIGAGESTVRTAIAALEKDGWLTRKQRRQGNRNASNVYQLNVSKLQSAAFAHLSDSDASKSDPSKSDASKFDPSKFEASKSGKKTGFDPSESGGDPSVKSNTDPSDKKPSCPVASQPDQIDQADLVLEHFNRVTNSAYGKGGRTKTTLGYIRGRLAEDYSPEDLMLVVDYLYEKWAKDPKMSDYLRPKTLFAPENCVEYFDKAKKWESAGRPAWSNGKWVGRAESAAARASFDGVDYSLPENSGFRV
ncbi:TPA: conserved phage C-terminal domain-containing protein [Escherichia coli]|uniref:conserved phage C-terminal domain-containing protein n=1 Tax=Escherichia coli TaxID=562 RepID=UPI002FE3ECE0|nr:GntR family transcriptional regulator [Escherichia coli]HCH9731127.1 conserved phage C-terminal domain-containing protein [Escherichia coli]HCI3407186.1 conserved phage C-terminal domain-containing protein [Escherichia coli]